MNTTNPVQNAFDRAKREFENGLNNRALVQDILTVNTIDQVYETLEKLQVKQRKQDRLRYLARAEPFLKCLQSYASVIEVFIQVKPDVLCLIWGPIRLLLLWSSEIKESFDAILNITEKLAMLLPQFKEVVELFSDKERITATLGLFFQDMLDFYLIALKFFNLRRWQILFEALWPRKKAEIEVVEKNIEKHSQMLRSEITVEHLRKAYEARSHAFDSFRRIEDSQASQKLQSLEVAIDPRFYDNELHRHRSDSCQGTVEWLLQDPIVSQWLDVSSSVNMLWLQGIPGAGKTFAASFVVEKALKAARTLYIFASYRHTFTTAISVLQSLLFQLSSDEPSVQSLLTEFNQRDLKSNTKKVAELLKTAISVVGPVFVIVDGVDEIDECERTHILCILLDTLKESSEMKICFSSRAEDDIDRIIGAQAKIIRVDKKNSGSIQSYINYRTKQLIDKHRFSPAAKKEIVSLISPVAANSKGMFLYARIVMDNVTMLNDVEEVRHELRALPKDLDAAYQRIINRVNRLSPGTVRQKAIKILGWVATSPVPLTLGELQQALLIRSSTDDAPTVSSLLNIVELCGPIVELKDDQPQFVHFTAQEYIMNSEVANFLDKEQAAMDLLTVCVSYLCYDTMSNELSDAAIIDSILMGKFRLLDFAASNWMLILAMCYSLSPSKRRTESIHGLLADLIFKRTNYWFIEPDGPPGPVDNGTTMLEGHNEIVFRTQRFIDNQEKDEWELKNGNPSFHFLLNHSGKCLKTNSYKFYAAEKWINLDPLIISTFRVRVHDLLDGLLCKEKSHQLGCNCGEMKDLKQHWGSRPFKCPFFTCSFFRQGFQTRKACDDHIKHHNKPWKCFASSCDWAEIGFTSKFQRDNHWLKVHEKETSVTPIPLDSLSDPDVFQSLLFELVSIGNVDELQRLLPHATSIIREVRLELTRFAARRGSLPMVQLLFPWCFRAADKSWTDDEDTIQVTLAAIESEDVHLIKWILPKNNKGHWLFGLRYRPIIAAVICTNSVEVFDVWEDSLGDFKKEWGSAMFGEKVLVAAKDHPAMERLLMETWRMLWESKRLSAWDLGCGLCSVASSSLSIPQAKVLLELGAHINHPRNLLGKKGLTPLHTALKKSTAERAEFVKFLLMKGANPEYGYGNRNVDSEIGAIEISRWLGICWEELVESTQEFRARDSNLESESE
ncbi:hypothetical protein TCE0_022r06309 [Talaromyces pinophilus]|uniref:Uncharacterized protein n=1 Tax=Talaromyces pinophilus TaxID=128442 RepID=A0A6V8H7K8_TALPI|nr:hypothetical protein TCE0_022r06309 [Talaromyces pinophilus]